MNTLERLKRANPVAAQRFIERKQRAGGPTFEAHPLWLFAGHFVALSKLKTVWPLPSSS